MSRKSIFPRSVQDLAQTHPALSILRMASLLAEAESEPDAELLGAMSEQVDGGFLLDIPPSEIWPELVRGLVAPSAGKMIKIMRDCGALAQILPEVADLFGVPQMADQLSPVDLGDHLLKALDEAARCQATLAARFALLVMNVGKADSPREHLPIHYRHVERGHPRIAAICERFAAPVECRDLAVLALDECERVHRVSRVRAGPVAMMLERLKAFSQAEVFRQLMTVCACDYRAYGDRSGLAYPKAALLDLAIEACAGADCAALSDNSTDVEELRRTRAEAIARAFRSQKWSDEAT